RAGGQAADGDRGSAAGKVLGHQHDGGFKAAVTFFNAEKEALLDFSGDVLCNGQADRVGVNDKLKPFVSLCAVAALAACRPVKGDMPRVVLAVYQNSGVDADVAGRHDLHAVFQHIAVVERG